MKKAFFTLLLLAALCFIQLKTHAQTSSRVGLTGGVSVTNIYGDKGGIDFRGKPRAGYTLGMIMDVPMCKNKFNFQPGVHYVQKGMFTKKTESVREADALRYIDFIFNFLKHTGKPNNTSLYFGIGPQIGLNVPSKKIKVEDGERKELGSINFGKTPTSDYRGIDWGANGLIGIQFKNGIFFATNYTFGLRNLIPVPKGKDNLRNGALGIRLGYLFPATPNERQQKPKKNNS